MVTSDRHLVRHIRGWAPAEQIWLLLQMERLWLVAPYNSLAHHNVPKKGEGHHTLVYPDVLHNALVARGNLHDNSSRPTERNSKLERTIPEKLSWPSGCRSCEIEIEIWAEWVLRLVDLIPSGNLDLSRGTGLCAGSTTSNSSSTSTGTS